MAYKQFADCPLDMTHTHTHGQPGLAVLRKLAVRPKRGHPPLFAVYTLCHAGGAAAEGFRRALVSSGEGGASDPRLLLLVDPPPAAEGEGSVIVEASSSNGEMVKETLAVREAGPGAAEAGGKVPRTAEYRRVMDDMSLPDNDCV